METEDKIKTIKNEITTFTNRLNNLLIERSELYKSGIAIKAQYVLKIGVYELKRYRLFYNIEKIRRKIALYQIALERGEAISEDDIDFIVNEDTKEFQKQLELLSTQLEIAEEYQKENDETIKQINDIYRKIVRKIHPDLNPNIDESTKELWEEAKEAYEIDDFEKLKEIESKLENIKIESFDENDYEKLVERKTTLQRRIYEEKLRLRDMEKEFPYNKTSILDDEEMVKEVVSEIKEEIEKLEKKYEELQIRLDFIKDPQRGVS
ncbi:MAG TPA: hypothetical protein GXZ48_04580 [Acholeplasmataceae bacterium]|nr:hypothetical protein [Acholeplasmataceae bacterium]